MHVRKIGTAILLMLLGLGAFAQVAAPAEEQKTRSDRAWSNINGNVFLPRDINQLLQYGDKAALVKRLKEAFDDKSLDEDAKGRVAAALVKAGEEDGYWDYLTKPIDEALQNGMPYPFDLVSTKNAGQVTSSFKDWASAHNLTVDDAVFQASTEIPRRILFAGLSGDKRAIPLLHRALQSDSYGMQTSAAMAVANLHDESAIPLIIRAASQTSGADSVIFAVALLTFPDSRLADAAAERLAPAEVIKEMKGKIASGYKPFSGDYPN